MSPLALLAAGLPVAIGIRLMAVAAAVALNRRPRACRAAALGGSILASAITASVGAGVLLVRQPVDGVLASHLSGIVLGYAVMPLSAWFLVVLGLVAAPVAVYSFGYFDHAIPASRMAAVGAGFNVLLGAVEMVFAAGDVVVFLCAWEMMSLATAALVGTDHEEGANRRAAYLYLVMSHVGTGCLIAGMFTLASLSGSLAFPAMFAGDVVSGPARDALFVLFFLGFGVKAGVIPLHVWLPGAHPAAPSSISALMSAVLITTGVYGLFRVCAFGLGVPHVNWGLALMAIGALSAILGVLYALTQNDLKRLLAYSTIENAGIMVLGLGAGMTALAYGRAELAAVVIAASLYHALNHAVFKGLLFLGAGSVVAATGVRQMESFGGLLVADERNRWSGRAGTRGSEARQGEQLAVLLGNELLGALAVRRGNRQARAQLQERLLCPEPVIHEAMQAGHAAHGLPCPR